MRERGGESGGGGSEERARGESEGERVRGERGEESGGGEGVRRERGGERGGESEGGERGGESAPFFSLTSWPLNMLFVMVPSQNPGLLERWWLRL